MADEPLAKKSRRTEQEEEPPREEREIREERLLRLDLSGYSDWVRKLSDEELEKIFLLGVLAKESLTMTVDSNQEHLENVLDSKMKPVHQTVDSIGSQVKKTVQEIEGKVTKNVSDNIMKMTGAVSQFQYNVNNELMQIKSDLVSKVSGVADKVLPLDSLNNKIDQSKDTILKEVKILEQAVKDLAKPQTKGIMGETNVLNILKAGLPAYDVQNVARSGHSGDVRVTSPEGEEFLIEVKNHENPVAKQEIEKFETEVHGSVQAKVGIMLSLKSGIAKRSTRRKFEIYLNKGKYFIYVPKAIEDRNLIVWSVMLANELAQMNAELNVTQKSKLSSLYDSFNRSIDNARRSRRNLQSLEEAVKKLKDDMEPILDIVEKSKTEIYKLLH